MRLTAPPFSRPLSCSTGPHPGGANTLLPVSEAIYVRFLGFLLVPTAALQFLSSGFSFFPGGPPFGDPRGVSSGQESGEKRPLTIADYKDWRTISGTSVSPDGIWVAWSYTRIRGDDTLHVANLETGSEHVV